MDQSFAFSTTWNILIPLLPIDAQRCWIRSDAACYHLQMITALKQMLPRIESWPPDDQQALVEAARAIEAERSGVYHASPKELAAIDRGLATRATAASPASRLLKRFARSFVTGEDSLHGLRARGPRGDPLSSGYPLAVVGRGV
jgi:hypothetical protein